MRTVLRPSLLALVTLCLGALFPADTSAQSIGSFRWQLQPYCNILTLSVFQAAGGLVIEGVDDQCGATRTAVIGSAFLNPDGSIAVGLTTILRSGGAPVHLEASVHVASLSGPWHDSVGNQGGFVFTPAAGIGGARRSGETNGIALDSVTFDQLASSVVSAIPPRERFSFDDDGTFFVVDQEAATSGGPVSALAWAAAPARFVAAAFDPTTGGRSRNESDTGGGLASWGGGLNPVANGNFAFAFGDHASVNGNASVAIGRDVTAEGDTAVAMGALSGACGDGSVVLGARAATASAPEFAGLLDEMCNGNRYAHAFVFSDGSAATFPDSAIFPAGGDNTFIARASGGVKFLATTGSSGCGMAAGGATWACSSDRHLKERFEALDGEDVLRKLIAIPVDAWSFIGEGGVRHAGPTAQDFHAAFGLGSDDTSIGYTDINGINMRAIQALEARTRELIDLKARMATLERLVSELLDAKR